MSIISLSFILFLLAIVFLYFCLPKKCQWVVLLVSSCAFYLSFGPKYFLTILFTSMSIFLSSNYMENLKKRQKDQIKKIDNPTREEKKTIKKLFAKKRKMALCLTLVMNFGLLAFFKYTPFLSEQVNNISILFSQGPILKVPEIIAPLGISFYTFQSTGYLIDVYWEKYEAEKNPFKFFLFTSFFPQIIQGPINRYDLLNHQFHTPHSFDYKNFSFGCQRMLWGFFKKVLIADRLSFYVSDVFDNFSEYSGLSVLFGAFLYSIQIYADFSGYMDIFCGFCEILGIEMSENFERPYFSKSIAEYWRRWHITLGSWFKDYLYYPIAFSKFSLNSAKSARKLLGDHIGKNTPAVLALILVWFTTGLWHGANWAYIAWGGINGFFIIVSMLLEPLFEKSKVLFKINEKSKCWRAFQTIRTFGLVTLIKVFPEVGSFSDGCNFLKSILTNFKMPASIYDVILPIHKTSDLPVICIGVAAMFAVSLIQRKISFREYFSKAPIIVRWAVYICAIVVLLVIGQSAGAGGFMYAQF